MENYPVVILGAGESSRFWPLNKRQKSLFYLMGKPVIWWNLKGIERVGLKNIFIVQSPRKDIEEELKKFSFKKLKIKFLIQKTPKSSGDALWQAREYLKMPFFVLNHDVLCSDIILKAMIEKIKKGAKAVLVGQETETPWLYGMMRLKGEKILEIIEKPAPGKEPSKIKVVGGYFLRPVYFNFYQKVKKHPYDFEDALSLYMKKEETILAKIPLAEKETPAFLKYPWHVFNLRKYLFDKFLEKKIEKGVKIGKNVIIEGKVFIGRGTKILEGAIIKGPCYIGRNCLIGNHSLLREYVNLEDNVIIGAFAEVARSVFQEGATCHSGYFGDSLIGKNTKIGAGTITSNLRLDRGEIKSEVKGKIVNTGLNYFGAVIGEDTLIGTNVNIMPGKFIGRNCQVFPNALILKNIPDNTLFPKNFRKKKQK